MDQLEQLLESAYKAGASKDYILVQNEGWRCWKYANRLKIEELSAQLLQQTNNEATTSVGLSDWEDISTAPLNVWLICRNANKRVFEAMKCSNMKSYCWVDRTNLLREPKEWNKELSQPEIENQIGRIVEHG